MRNKQVAVLRENPGARMVVASTWELPSQQSVKQVASKATRTYLLSDEGHLYHCEAAECASIENLSCPAPVKMLACNASAVLVVSDTGQLYALGRDDDCYGFLGGLDVADQFTLLPGLTDTLISQAGLGSTHGAALDSTS